MKVRIKSDPMEAWRCDPWLPTPQWVKNCTELSGGELLLIRPSGKQALKFGEWLVKNYDGGIIWFTDERFEREMEVVP